MLRCHFALEVGWYQLARGHGGQNRRNHLGDKTVEADPVEIWKALACLVSTNEIRFMLGADWLRRQTRPQSRNDASSRAPPSHLPLLLRRLDLPLDAFGAVAEEVANSIDLFRVITAGGGIDLREFGLHASLEFVEPFVPPFRNHDRRVDLRHAFKINVPQDS